jgi:hypothetical protein
VLGLFLAFTAITSIKRLRRAIAVVVPCERKGAEGES